LQLRKPGILLILYLLACLTAVRGQGRLSSPFSNLRFKTIPTAQDSVKLDSLSIAPGSLTVVDVPDSMYSFSPERSVLRWKAKPQVDSVRVRYRVLPLAFGQLYSHKSQRLIDSNFVSYIYRQEDETPGNFLEYNQLEYNGSYGRSITVGNNQDVVLNSQFNLQVNGYILDSIKLEAAITDNTVPFQPEGNTQRLQEFDQIYIRLMKNKNFLQLGDYNLESPPGYFLKFYKRVQGIYYQTEFDVNKKVTNRLGLSGSVAKGQFVRNIFQGQEGNQGPYKLTANNGELFFIVLAGTERVYVDNVLMERGENADYIINYNTGEVRFMARRMITKDSRIQVEFEYQDRNYLNSLLYGYDELQVGKKWNIRFNAYSNQDAKNQPYLQNLTGEQKRFLSVLGDSIQYAYYPNIQTDTFAANKILYKLVDTTVAGQHYDSVFVYTVNPDSARFSLAFSYVGEGKGNYVISLKNANGRVYDWVAPVNGVPQGNYAPVQLLVTPKKQQVFILTNTYQIDSLKSLNVEVGASNADPNLYSKIDDNAHWGLATKVNYNEVRPLGKRDSVGRRKWRWQNHLSYEYVQDRFKAIAPYRNVEFTRDWNVPIAGYKPDEHLVYATTKMSNAKAGTAGYNFSYYQRGFDYVGYRNILAYDYNYKRIRAGFVGNVLNAADSAQESSFYRPSVYGEYFVKELFNTYIGGKYEVEHNEMRSRRSDTLLPTAFSFDIASAYIRTSDQQPTRWSLGYFTRRDRRPFHNQFVQQNHSNNVDVKLGLSQWKNQFISFTGTYRQLIVDDTIAKGLKPDETLLGRLEYTGGILKNFMSVNSLYEFGSGQEQKQSYVYIEVPAGTGVYTWIDYNGDGVQQSNEFQVALYPDQKTFNKVYTPTNEYVKVNYVNFNFSLMLEPSVFWQGKAMKGWQKFASRLSSQTSLQISNRLLAEEGVRAYNPFIEVLRDESIILTNSSLSNSIYFNRSSAKWGIDYNMLYNAGKQLLRNGVEGNLNRQHLYKVRWNITPPVTVNLAGKNGNRSYQSALEDRRSYDIATAGGEGSVTWLYRSVFRVTGIVRYDNRKNDDRYGGEQATIQGLDLDLRYSKPTVGVIQLRGSYSSIDFTGSVTDPVAFTMLDALQKGSNYLWYMNWERRVGRGLELSFEYEGRKPGVGTVIHTGRMSVRAIL
jgi:hypothetical protein